MSLNCDTNILNVNNNNKIAEKPNSITMKKEDNLRAKRTDTLKINIKNKELKTYNKTPQNEYMENNIEIKDKEVEDNKNKNELFLKRNNIIYLDSFKNILQHLHNASNEDLRQKSTLEYYLVPKLWLREIFDLIKKEYVESVNIQPINNNMFLVDKQTINKAIFLNEEEKNSIIIIKPKYAFCTKIRPYPLNKQLWEFLLSTFGGGPEIKLLKEKKINEKGEETLERDYFRYVKINCIILPRKSHCGEKEIKQNIQKFFFLYQ